MLTIEQELELVTLERVWLTYTGNYFNTHTYTQTYLADANAANVSKI